MLWELAETAADSEVGNIALHPPSANHAPEHGHRTDSSRHDLDLIEQLLARCWREIDAAELNIKLGDLVRLLEFKEKLRPSVEAQETFWAMINQMRHEELNRIGETNADHLADRAEEADSETDHPVE